MGSAVNDVSVLDGLLSKNATINQALKDLQGMQQKMSNLLLKTVKDFPGLQGFISTFDDFNDELKKLKKLDASNRWLSQPMGIMDDLMAMKGFLEGMVNKGILKINLLKSTQKHFLI